MEAWGRGIANIFDECEKYGLPTPEFKVGHKIVTLVIRFKNSITPHRKGDEPVNEPVKTILKLITENPHCTKEVISGTVGKSRATITRILSKLQKDGIIKRVGADKNGYWKIIK